MATFDECFATLPDLKEQPRDFDAYWKKQVARLKKVPLGVETTKKVRKKLLTETNIFLSFQSIGKTRLNAQLMSPKKFRKKPPVVIVFPDYHEEATPMPGLTQAGIAQFILQLRGHDKVFEQKESPAEEAESDQPQKKSYGYFAENLLSKDKYYMNQLFLDAFRTLEVIRLRREIDSSRIGVWGRGVGAAMALFVTRLMKRTSGLFLEEPSFAHLDLTQNISKSRYAQEINQFVKSNRKQASQVKSNLRYFDGLYFSPGIDIPLAMAINLKNNRAVPQGGFAMFHHVPSHKEMHLFTNDDEKSLKEQSKKVIDTSIDFFSRYLVK